MKLRSRLWVSLLFLGGLNAAVIFAGFLAPCDPDAQNRAFPFAPPMLPRIIDSENHWHFRPFVYDLVPRAGGRETYQVDTTKRIPLKFFMAGENRNAPNTGGRFHLFGVEPSGHLFLLGTDSLGRDQFSRLLYGGRISLMSGFLAVGVSLALGLMLGALAGFFGKWVDEAIMRLAELLLALPWLYCLLALRAFLPLHISPERTVLLVIMVLATRGWARPARLVRGIVLTEKERDYVLAARGFGASNPYLLLRHILPQTYGVMLTQAGYLIPQYILAEVTLSFLGLGVGEPSATWGSMLASLQHYNVLTSYWWMSLPGLLLIPVFLSFQVLADAVHERLAPQLGDLFCL